MSFSDLEISQVFTLCKRMEPRTIDSIQDYEKESDLRKGVVYGIKNKRREYICLFSNFGRLNKVKSAILDKMVKRLPFETYITYPDKDIVRIGWKK